MFKSFAIINGLNASRIISSPKTPLSSHNFINSSDEIFNILSHGLLII